MTGATGSSGAARVADHPRVVAATGAGTWWSRLDHLEEVTSTHDVALTRLRDGEEPGFVLAADRQTRGRGRAGRGWEDGPTPDASLMLTATVRAPAGELSLVPLAVGLAVGEVIGHLGIEVGLKWPNDVLAGARKCTGILVERHTLPAGDVLLIGIGIDVDWRSVERSGDRAAWTSLAEEAGRDIDRSELLGELLDALASQLGRVSSEPDTVLTSYRERCLTLGQDVEVELPDGGTLTGQAVDVDRGGRLLVDTARERVAVTAGDVHLVPDVS